MFILSLLTGMTGARWGFPLMTSDRCKEIRVRYSIILNSFTSLYIFYTGKHGKQNTMHKLDIFVRYTK